MIHRATAHRVSGASMPAVVLQAGGLHPAGVTPQASGLRYKIVFVCFAMLLLVVMAGCGRMQTAGAPPQDGFAMTMTAQPAQPVIGDGQLIVTLADSAGKPVTNARLEVEGNMSHAGMKPSPGAVTAANDGRYTVAIRWTMAGDWYVDIKATLADGRVIGRRFPISVHAR